MNRHLVRARQTKNVLTDRVEHHFLRNRSNLSKPTFAQYCSTVIVTYVSIAAESLYGPIASLRNAFVGGSQLRDIRLRTPHGFPWSKSHAAFSIISSATLASFANESARGCAIAWF